MMNNYWIDGDLYNWTVQRYRLRFKGAQPVTCRRTQQWISSFNPMHYEFLKERVASRITSKQTVPDKMQKALENCEHKDITIIDAGYDTNKNYKRGM